MNKWKKKDRTMILRDQNLIIKTQTMIILMIMNLCWFIEFLKELHNKSTFKIF